MSSPTDPHPAKAVAAPGTPVQAKLVELLAKELRLENVGICDDLSELGGRSLLATQVISRVREAFHVELPPRSLFESRTVAGLAEHIEALLILAQAGQGGQGPELQIPREGSQRRGDSAVRRAPREGPLPLSFAQQRLWFLDQLELNSTAYNLPVAYRLVGRMDATALEQAINEIVRRHEVLRTTFAVVDGEPVQVVAPSLIVPLPIADLRSLPKDERETEALRLVGEEAHSPFDLSRGPLLRAQLVRLCDEEHVLILNMHHIVSDGWSLGVFRHELSALYAAFSQRRPSPLPELPVQYADFASWQREWLQGAAGQAQLDYWKEQLQGVPLLEFPTDRPRSAGQKTRGVRQSLVLHRNLVEDLRLLCRREGVTLFMALMAAFNALLYRWTGQDDIAIGTPVANRNRTETEGSIGFFVNTLVLRTDLSGNPSVQELLARVREVSLGAYAHQDLPFEKLVEQLRPERSLIRNPLFDIMVNFSVPLTAKGGPPPTLELAGLRVEREEEIEPEAKFLMTLYATERDGQVALHMVYESASLSDDRIACLLRQFRFLLEQMVATPEQRIGAFSLVTPEARPLLPDPCAALSEPRYALVTDMYMHWVDRTPEATAVSQGDQAWTYRELGDSVLRISRALLAQGLEPGDVVAVCGLRSFGLVAGAMATFLAGGVLLTIDRSLPESQQQLMLREARVRHILCISDGSLDARSMHDLPGRCALQVEPSSGRPVGLPPNWDWTALPLPDLAPEHPAYIFFTSGTTGRPQAILGSHKGLSHFLVWQRETFGVGPGDRVAQLTTLSFDVVLRDIFLPLTSGATLCLPEDSDDLGPERTMRWIEEQRISVLHAVPTLTQYWLDALPPDISLRCLRWVFFAGEPLMDRLVSRWRECFPQAGQVVNLYGPTETTMAKCYCPVPANLLLGVQPLGRPLPATQALILKGDHQLCGIGEPGEIVLRTPFRTLGYLNVPDENRERFVKNPYRDDDRDLLYFTGDGGRYRPDGALEFLGRLDDQVKIRGVRVEPDEVTAILSQHPAVKTCVVVARQDEQGNNLLVAYAVVAHPGPAVLHELRTHLSTRLPAAKVPSAFVFLDQLPRSANGKVDRSALPTPSRGTLAPEEDFVSPRGPTEQALAGIWSQVLGTRQVGIHDNFFDLGGHSLLATQVVSRIRQVLRVELPLRRVFEHPTVAELAQAIATQRAGQADSSVLATLLAELDHLSDEEATRALGALSPFTSSEEHSDERS